MNESNAILRGSLDAIILTLLSSKGRMYGYEICQHVKELSSGHVRVTEGALYPALHKLEGEGLLVSHSEMISGRARKYYSIAPEQEEQALGRLGKIQDFVARLQTILNPVVLPNVNVN